MSLENHIIRNLASGQASARSLADTLSAELDHVTAILQRLVKERQLTTFKVADIITVYKLA